MYLEKVISRRTFGVLKVTDEKIAGSGSESVPKFHGYATLLGELQDAHKNIFFILFFEDV
jgi:hypothetical protein